MSLLSLLKFVHLVGLIAGLGGAVLADLLILRQGVLRPIRKRTIVIAKHLSHLVLLGLAILWVTGVALVWVRYQLDPKFITNEKVWAKVAIVSLLTANGIAVHAVALPMLVKRLGRRLFDLDRPLFMTGLSFVGAVSLTSWMAPFFLGVAAELNYTTPAITILTGYAMAVLAAWFAITLVNHWATATQWRQRKPADGQAQSLRQVLRDFLYQPAPRAGH